MLKKHIGKNILCGLTDTLRHLLELCHRQRLNNILKIRDNKTDPLGSVFPFKFGECILFLRVICLVYIVSVETSHTWHCSLPIFL